MTLWNIIRDFFVQYVFGGYNSNGDIFYDNFLGNVYMFDAEGNSLSATPENTAEGLMVYLKNTYCATGGSMSTELVYMSIGDWLSTTATIITLVGLFIAITLLIISLFKWIVRLVSLRG